MSDDPVLYDVYNYDFEALSEMIDHIEEEAGKMSEGYHGFDVMGDGRCDLGGGAQQSEATWQTSGPASPTINDIKVTTEGVRDIRRVIDELRVYADKLTADVKVPRKELKGIIDRLSKAMT